MNALATFDPDTLDASEMRDGARWAYRLLLNREPESEEVLDHYAALRSPEQLRNSFTRSPEYLGITYSAMMGTFSHADPADIEVTCSPADLERMLARIAREWQKFGATEPHWSVLTGDEFKQDNIGHSIDTFYDTGFRDIERLLKGAARAEIDVTRFDKVLDFGCGVGRLVLALAPRAGHVTGIDISPAHISLARERVEQTGCRNVDFASIAHLDDLDGFSGFDLVTCYIVIQHNPPPVQNEIIRKLLSALRPGGIAVLQVPTYLVHANTFSVAEYLANESPSMEMNALPQHVIFETIDAMDCTCLEVREDGAMGTLAGISNTFTIRKKG
jgi:2-polyprenyl-3-methyl-5-hydroxy-6-metoxy-1,4-benzoquinol methylase